MRIELSINGKTCIVTTDSLQNIKDYLDMIQQMWNKDKNTKKVIRISDNELSVITMEGKELYWRVE